MIVASREIAGGAADIALAINSASVFGLCWASALAVVAKIVTRHTATNDPDRIFQLLPV
jgi:hypothetical protein